jgi:hypothetical protein
MKSITGAVISTSCVRAFRRLDEMRRERMSQPGSRSGLLLRQPHAVFGMNRLQHLLPGKVQRGPPSGSVGGLRSLGGVARCP